MFFVVALSMVITFISCQKDKISFPDPNTLPKGLLGSWVETSAAEDTISFSSDGDTGLFYYSRGFAMTNGYWLPKIGSAPYLYIIAGESIEVTNGLSSSREGGTYYFNFDEPNLTFRIGKFSEYIAAKKTILTFRKIK